MKKQSLNTLRDYSRFRILDEMIKTVSANVGNPIGYYILVVDKESVKVLSSICRMYDLVSYKISTVEQLTLSRKRFPSSDAIYLVSPTKSAIGKIVEDFKEASLPQYGWVHLCFLGPVSEELFTMLGKSEGLMPRVKTFKELNINFLLKEAEIFHYGAKPSLNFYSSEDPKPWLSACANRLMTVCCTFVENPYIQYYKGSKQCQILASMLQKVLPDFSKKSSKDVKPHEPRGTVIIVDRNFDINAPIMHDFCYEALMYDLFQVSKEGMIDPDDLETPWPETEEEKKLDPSKKKVMVLGESDTLWKQYRYLHIAEVLQN